MVDFPVPVLIASFASFQPSRSRGEMANTCRTESPKTDRNMSRAINLGDFPVSHLQASN